MFSRFPTLTAGFFALFFLSSASLSTAETLKETPIERTQELQVALIETEAEAPQEQSIVEKSVEINNILTVNEEVVEDLLPDCE